MYQHHYVQYKYLQHSLSNSNFWCSKSDGWTWVWLMKCCHQLPLWFWVHTFALLNSQYTSLSSLLICHITDVNNLDGSCIVFNVWICVISSRCSLTNLLSICLNSSVLCITSNSSYCLSYSFANFNYIDKPLKEALALWMCCWPDAKRGAQASWLPEICFLTVPCINYVRGLI